MPRRRFDDSMVPPDVLSRAIGSSEVRGQILHIAFRDGPCTAAAFMLELGISRSGLTNHLRPLVAAGLLIPETDPNNTNPVGGSNRRCWRIDVDAFDAAVETFSRHVKGDL
jgi:DNA-binding MarR family transcriptional regulator